MRIWFSIPCIFLLIGSHLGSVETSVIGYPYQSTKNETVQQSQTVAFENRSKQVEVLLEGKISYYYLLDKTIRRIYGGSALYGIETSVEAHRRYYPWVSISILSNSGKSINVGTKTSLFLVPIGIGMKYLFNVPFGNIFIGAGVLPTYLHTHDRSEFVIQKRSKWGVGGIFKTGMLINLPKSFFLDAFFEYTILSMSFPNTEKTMGREVDLDSLSAGAGIGYRF